MPCLIESALVTDIALLGLCAGLALLGRLIGQGLARSTHSTSRRAPSGVQLGPYVLTEKIGAGGMGEVYRAWHGALERWCAVKVLPPHASARERRRFAKEVRVTARLSHPNTVCLYDHGQEPDGTAYYAMELLEGVSLQQLVQREGPLPPRRVIHILQQICAALGEAHAAGLVHRDIKPDNIVLCERAGLKDVAKVVDFGLVKQVANDIDEDDLDKGLIGTPQYLSPEAITAPETVNAQSDLYGLGAVAYYLLTGAPVFSGRNVIEVCGHHLHSEPERPSRITGRAIPRDLERLVLACLAKDASDRPASAAVLAHELAACDVGSFGEPALERPWHGSVTPSFASFTGRIDSRLNALERLVAEERACA
jgi:serine/threonine protein kinase